MRILQVVHQFLPKYSGGTEVYTADLMRRLRDRGHELALLTGGDRPDNTTWEGIPVTVVPGGLRGPGGPGALFLATFGSWDAEDMFRKLARDFRPQVVHFQHLLGLSSKLPAFARKAKVPSVATLHDYWFTCPKSQLIDEHGDPCSGPHWGVNCVRCAAARLDSPLVAKAAPLLAPAFMLRQRTVRNAYRRVDRLLAPSDFLLQQALHALTAKLRR